MRGKDLTTLKGILEEERYHVKGVTSKDLTKSGEIIPKINRLVTKSDNLEGAYYSHESELTVRGEELTPRGRRLLEIIKRGDPQSLWDTFLER